MAPSTPAEEMKRNSLLRRRDREKEKEEREIAMVQEALVTTATLPAGECCPTNDPTLYCCR